MSRIDPSTRSRVCWRRRFKSGSMLRKLRMSCHVPPTTAHSFPGWHIKKGLYATPSLVTLVLQVKRSLKDTVVKSIALTVDKNSVSGRHIPQ